MCVCVCVCVCVTDKILVTELSNHIIRLLEPSTVKLKRKIDMGKSYVCVCVCVCVCVREREYVYVCV